MERPDPWRRHRPERRALGPRRSFADAPRRPPSGPRHRSIRASPRRSAPAAWVASVVSAYPRAGSKMVNALGSSASGLDHVGQGSLSRDPLDQFDDLAFLGEAPGEFGMGILVVALGAHRDASWRPCPRATRGHGRRDLGRVPRSGFGVDHRRGRRPPDGGRPIPRASPAGSGNPRPVDPERPLSSAPHSWAIRPTCRPLMVDLRPHRRGTPRRRRRNVPRTAARTILPRIAGEKLCESSRKLGRRGKKIPATSRAMTDRFVVLDRPAATLNRS